MTEIRVINHLPEFQEQLEARANMVLKQMAEDAKRYSQMKVPKKTGELRSTAEVEQVSPTHYRIWYDRYGDLGYAAYQEFGVRADGSHRVKNHTKASSMTHYLRFSGERIGKSATKYFRAAFKRIPANKSTSAPKAARRKSTASKKETDFEF